MSGYSLQSREDLPVTDIAALGAGATGATGTLNVIQDILIPHGAVIRELYVSDEDPTGHKSSK